MVKRWPDLERGESASETGRTHIPPRLFKEAAHLNRQRDMLMKLLREVSPFNAKKKSAELAALLEQYIPGVERMQTQMRKYDAAYRALRAENVGLKKQVNSGQGEHQAPPGGVAAASRVGGTAPDGREYPAGDFEGLSVRIP